MIDTAVHCNVDITDTELNVARSLVIRDAIQRRALRRLFER